MQGQTEEAFAMSSTGDWLARVLWELSPFLLVAAFVALGAAVGGGLFLLLARKMSVRRSVATVAAVVLGCVVLIALAVTWSLGVLVPASGPEPFEAGAWHSRPWTQWGMAQQLVESDRLLGMEREDVFSLLGHGGGSYSTPMGWRPDDVESWRLYRPQDLLVIPLPPLLVVLYRDGRVVRAWIEPGIVD